MMRREDFPRQGGPGNRSREMAATLNSRRSTLYLTGLVYEALGRPEYIEILLDNDHPDTFALRASEHTPDALKLSRTGTRSSTGSVAAGALRRALGMEPDEVRRWTGRVEDSLVIFDTRTAVRPPTRTR